MISIFENKKQQTIADMQAAELYGDKMSFVAKEAYKLLRTNLTYALSNVDAGRGHIVGITSALRGEGKSTTTINLASVLAEQGERVVVVEGDLRLPSLRRKIKLRDKAGLSKVLITRGNPLEYLQICKVGNVDEKVISFSILPAGELPPNPSELLGSKRMDETLNVLAKQYNYVLLDLPPVTAVSDALVATKLVDGIVMVVRNEYCDTGSLNEAIRQLQQVDSKILGFVFTCSNGSQSRYQKKYKYRYYDYSEDN